MSATSPRRFCITVDVDWIPGSEAGLQQLYDFCDDHALRGSFFFAGKFAEDYPHAVREAIERGHEVGTHGWAHGQLVGAADEDFLRAPAARQREWIVRSTSAVGSAAGVRPTIFRAPNLLISETTFEILREFSYTHDSSVPARRPSITYGKLNSSRYFFAPLARRPCR